MDSTPDTLFVLRGSVRVPRSPSSPCGKTLFVGDEINPADFSADELARLKRQRWVGPAKRPAAAVEAVAPKRASGSAPWNLDPAQLAGKDLDTLKVMIAERDPKFPLDEVTEIDEAVAQLSRDFAGTPVQVAQAQG